MDRDRPGPIPARWRAALARRLAIDTRGLAALRIAVGLLLLADLGLRAGDLVAFYTDAGVLPRSVLVERFPAAAGLSLHALSGAVWIEGLLFVLAAAIGLALVAGYHTRVATAASLVLLVSLHARNPVVLNAGDSLLRRLLLWGLFLPLGARWSVDATHRGRGAPRAAGLATAALLAQVVLVYVANAAFKLRGERWRSGEAIRSVFGLDHLTVRLGDTLATYPDLLVAADRLWLAMLVGAPMLVLLVGRARTALVGAFVTAHLGMALTLRLGLFPLVSVAALLPFLPPAAWDRLESWVGRAVVRLDRARRLGRVPPPVLPRAPAALADRVRRLVPGVVAGLLALVLVWNAASLGLLALPAAATSTVDPAEHRWDMFAPEPRTDDGWYVVAGTIDSGGRVDAFRGGPLTWDRPPELAAAYPSHRWFVYLLDLRQPANAGLRPAFADYVCRRWTARHEEPLTSVAVYFVAEPVRLDGTEPRRRIELYRGGCSP